MSAPPAPVVLAANGHSRSATSTVALLEEEPKVPGGGAIDSLVRPLVESVAEPAQLALPGLEALVAPQVEAGITSAVVPPAQAFVPTHAVVAPIETPVIAAVSELAEPAAAPVESTRLAAPSEPVEAPGVATVAEPTQTPVASVPDVEAPVESVVAVPVESTQIPVASVPVEAPVVASVAEPMQTAVASAPDVEAPVESVVAAPVTESAQLPAASAPVEAPVAASVAESTQTPTTSAPVEAPVESVVDAPVTESAQLPAASAPVEAPVIASVADSTRTPTASAPVEAPIESVVDAPVTESAQIPVASAPVEAPVESLVAAQLIESAAPIPTTLIAESINLAAPPAPAETPTEETVSTVTPVEPLLIGPAVEPKQIAASSATDEAPITVAFVAPVTESAETAAAAQTSGATAHTSVEPTVFSAPVESDLSAALKLQAEAVLDAMALQAEADNSGILAIRDSFRKPPNTSLLTAPLKLVTAPAPPAEQWKRTARPIILSRKPAEPKPALMSSGPQTSTLAGPCLPLELRTLVEDPSAAKARTQKRAGFPTWMVSVVVATFLFLGAGSLLQYVTGNRDAKAAAPASGLASVSTAGDRHPFAKFVEVTGLRVIGDQNHKSQLQYIVVNHSSAQISGMAIRIAVRSAAGSSETAPLFVVSASVPSLAPYQSKEIRTGLDAELRSSTIPDWENLRADVQVNNPPE